MNTTLTYCYDANKEYFTIHSLYFAYFMFFFKIKRVYLHIFILIKPVALM